MVVRMAVPAVWLDIKERSVTPGLQEAAERLASAEGHLVLDFVSVRRIDSSALRAMEGFAALAEQKAIKIVLHGVNVDIYKVLKLVRLAARFSFVSSDVDSGVKELESRHAKPSAE
jgi:anti-anti-sigma regulatory factor